MRRHLTLLAVLLLLPMLLAWPLPLVWGTQVLSAPDQEAATHAWGLWAALHEHNPLIGHTALLGAPEGARLVLVDAANLPWFAVGSLAGVVAGFNTVIWGGLVLMGLAGAALARQLGGRPWLGALTAMACPTLLANAADGMTEGFGVAWVGIQLALLLRYTRTRRPRDGLMAAVALAAAWYAGPYNGVWASLIDGVLFLDLIRRRKASVGLATALVGASAAAMVSPLAMALLGDRPANLPGSAARSGLPAVIENPGIFRGGLQTGADLLDPLIPGPLTGAQAEISHTAYLGVITVLLATLAVTRERRRWPWLAGALGFAALSLGPWLFLGGHVLRAGGRPITGPAGWLIMALPIAGRLTRWYRAGAVATLLLAPLVSLTPRRLAPLAAVLVLLDTLLLAPLAWPLHHSPPPATSAYAVLSGEGAIVELPPATTGPPPPGRWRDRTGLTQPSHGHPVEGGMMNLPMSPAGRKAKHDLEGLMRTGELPARALRRIREDGFRWLAIYPEYRAVPAEASTQIEQCLGPALVIQPQVWLYAIPDREDDCEPHRARPPVHTSVEPPSPQR